MTEKEFEELMAQSNMAKNTISVYRYALREFLSRYKAVAKHNLLLYPKIRKSMT